MEYATTYVRELRDDARIRQYEVHFREQDAEVGPAIVVHTDAETQKRWIVSDPHRHAAAARAAVEIPTIELREVFREAGLDYERELARAREADRGHHGGIVEEQVFVGSREWLDRVLHRLPEQTRRRYWTEPTGT